jgi:hypothetical protein
VSEQVDSLRVLFTDPVDYLVTPRVLASMIAGPILNVLCFCMGEHGLPAATCCCLLQDYVKDYSYPWPASCLQCVCGYVRGLRAVPNPSPGNYCSSSYTLLVMHQAGVAELILCCVVPPLAAGIGASVLLADLVYDVPANVILDSARRALSGYDVITSCIKAWVFGLIISTVRHQLLRCITAIKQGRTTCLCRERLGGGVQQSTALLTYCVLEARSYKPLLLCMLMS